MVFFHSIPCLIGEKVTKNILYSGSVFGFRPLQIFYELFFFGKLWFFHHHNGPFYFKSSENWGAYFKHKSSWWFQPNWKNWSSWIISPGRGENKNCLKPPASHPWEKKTPYNRFNCISLISGIKNRQLHQEKYRKKVPRQKSPHSLHQQNKTGKKEGQTRNPCQKAPTKNPGWVIPQQQKNTVVILPTQTILKGNPSKIQYIGLSPLPLPVTTRIITFLVGNPKLNLHFHYYWGGGTTQTTHEYGWFNSWESKGPTPQCPAKTPWNMALIRLN